MKQPLNCTQFCMNAEGVDDLIQMSAVSLLFSEEKYSVICGVKPLGLV